MDRTVGKSKTRNYDGERLMISLLEIAQSINEDPRGVDNIDRSKGSEKKDQDADRVGRDDGDTWMAPNGDYGGKHNGEIQYFDDEDSAKVYAKSGSKDGKGGEEKPEEPKGNIGKGDFERDSDDENPIGDKGDVGIGDLPDPSTRQGDPEANKAYQAKKAAEKPKGKLTQKGEKIQKAKEEFDDLMGDGGDPDEIGMWIDDNRYNLSGDGNPENISRAFSKLEDAYMDAEENDDWDAYDEQLEDLKNRINKRLDAKIDRNREEPKSDKPKDDSSKKSNLTPLSSLDTYYNKERVKNSMSPAEWKKLSYGELSNLLDKEHEKAGHKKVNGQWMKKESIKVINGKKYKAIKESKKNPRILKEIYDRTFRSLK